MVDSALPDAGLRPGPEVRQELYRSCRFLLHDREAFDSRYLAVLRPMLPVEHPLHASTVLALELLDVLLTAVLSPTPPHDVERICQTCGARCAGVGLPDDTYPAVGRAATRAARDLMGDDWTTALSSGWAAVHLWVVGQLTAGASLARSQGGAWHTFPELAPQPAPGNATSDGERTPGPPAGSDSEWAALERAAFGSPEDRRRPEAAAAGTDDVPGSPGHQLRPGTA